MKKHRAVAEQSWSERPVAIVASGPSVTSELSQRLLSEHTGHVIAVKDGFRIRPDADVLMCGDHRWERRGVDLAAYTGPLILYTDPDAPCPWDDPRIEYIPKAPGRGFSTDPTRLQGTFTTTCLAMNYAFLKGARELHLYGVDAAPGPNGERHFCNAKQETWNTRYDHQKWGYSRLIDDIRKYRMRVFNMNPNSNVVSFSKYGEVQWMKHHPSR